MEQSRFFKMIGRMCQLHPECENFHQTKVVLREEFIHTIQGLQGTEPAPYLAEMKCTPCDGCFTIAFKISLVAYNELRNL